MNPLLKNSHSYTLKTSAHTLSLCYFISITHALTYDNTNIIHTFINFDTQIHLDKPHHILKKANRGPSNYHYPQSFLNKAIFLGSSPHRSHSSSTRMCMCKYMRQQ